MNKVNKGTGAGGARTNLNGLDWEKSTYLKDALITSNFELIDMKEVRGKRKPPLFEVMKDSKLVGYYGQQGQLYYLMKYIYEDVLTNEYIKSVLSKKINPDGFIFNNRTNTLHIFEKKWQQSSGSVDEKLQTAPFKRAMFKKLLSNAGIEVTYQYILSKWFKDKQYRNIREYYSTIVEESSMYGLWTENLDLDKLRVEDFLK